MVSRNIGQQRTDSQPPEFVMRVVSARFLADRFVEVSDISIYVQVIRTPAYQSVLAFQMFVGRVGADDERFGAYVSKYTLVRRSVIKGYPYPCNQDHLPRTYHYLSRIAVSTISERKLSARDQRELLLVFCLAAALWLSRPFVDVLLFVTYGQITLPLIGRRSDYTVIIRILSVGA